GDPKDPLNDPPPPDVLRVAGNYPTAVGMISDDCGGTVIQSMPTTVTHTAGATTLLLTHAGSTYSGTIATNGSFSTTPHTSNINGSTYVVSLTGQFTRNGFTATVTVQRTDTSFPNGCQFVVAWSATRSSGENFIPG